ncbi:MAG TPA: hypothetical protein VHE99_12700 [Gammaproteobacteria bacterium]|nr:hypothetical protein [Gammaproteobacteria bacterium]
MRYVNCFERYYSAKALETGLKQGLELGQQQGEVMLLRKLLETKFGALSPNDERRLQQADSEQLLSWVVRILSAQSLQDFFQK